MPIFFSSTDANGDNGLCRQPPPRPQLRSMTAKHGNLWALGRLTPQSETTWDPRRVPPPALQVPVPTSLPTRPHPQGHGPPRLAVLLERCLRANACSHRALCPGAGPASFLPRPFRTSWPRTSMPANIPAVGAQANVITHLCPGNDAELMAELSNAPAERHAETRGGPAAPGVVGVIAGRGGGRAPRSFGRPHRLWIFCAIPVKPRPMPKQLSSTAVNPWVVAIDLSWQARARPGPCSLAQISAVQGWSAQLHSGCTPTRCRKAAGVTVVGRAVRTGSDIDAAPPGRVDDAGAAAGATVILRPLPRRSTGAGGDGARRNAAEPRRL